jgi:hypothetical protein
MKLAGQIVLALVIVLLLTISLTAFGMWQYGWVLPWQYQIERNAVKQSQSFTNSNNLQLSNLITQYNGLEIQVVRANSAGDASSVDAYKSQERAIISQMCMEVSTMADGTVNSNITSFLSQHGGCQ